MLDSAPQEKIPLGFIGVSGRIILKWVLNINKARNEVTQFRIRTNDVFQYCAFRFAKEETFLNNSVAINSCGTTMHRESVSDVWRHKHGWLQCADVVSLTFSLQINNRYWCKDGRRAGDCNIKCEGEFGRLRITLSWSSVLSATSKRDVP